MVEHVYGAASGNGTARMIGDQADTFVLKDIELAESKDIDARKDRRGTASLYARCKQK
jgi:hypothetical protein